MDTTQVSEQTKLYNFHEYIQVNDLMQALFGEEHPRQHLTFQVNIVLGDYGRLDTTIRATSIRLGDKKDEWHFDAYVEDLDDETGTHQPVKHPFAIGQKIRGKLNLRPMGPHPGVLYIVDETAH